MNEAWCWFLILLYGGRDCFERCRNSYVSASKAHETKLLYKMFWPMVVMFECDVKVLLFNYLLIFLKRQEK